MEGTRSKIYGHNTDVYLSLRMSKFGCRLEAGVIISARSNLFEQQDELIDFLKLDVANKFCRSATRNFYNVLLFNLSRKQKPRCKSVNAVY